MFGGADYPRSHFVLGDTWALTRACSTLERIRSVKCSQSGGGSNLTVLLGGGVSGTTFLVKLSDGTTVQGVIDDRGHGKARFKNRPLDDSGTATAEWSCGSIDHRDYTCD